MRTQATHLPAAVKELQREWSFLEPYALPISGLKDRSAVFVRTVKTEAQAVPAYIKVYANKKHPLQRAFRKSKSRTEVRNLLFFQSLGIPTPPVLAWGIRRNRIGRIVAEFIITQAIPDALQLDDFVAAHCPARTSPNVRQLRDQIIQQLGEWAARMHARNFIHEDLKWRNILAKPSGSGVELYWIDCPKGSFYKGSQLVRKKLKDCATLDKIARIECHKTERRNFLSAYLHAPPQSAEVTQLCERIEHYRSKRFDQKDDRQRGLPVHAQKNEN